MSANPLLISFLSLVFVLLAIKFTKRGSTKYNSPPSPRKLPLIGNLHQLSGGLPHHTLWALSKKYGPLMLLHFGRVPTLVVSSADVAHEVMKTHDHVFSSRPQVVFAKRLLYGKNLVFSPYGEYWRQLRKICVLQLLTAHKVKSFQYVREQEVGLAMEAIHDSSASVNLKEIFVAVSNNIVSRAALGKKYNEENGQSRFKVMIGELAYLMAVSNVADFIPSLSWVNYLNGLNSSLVVDAIHVSCISVNLKEIFVAVSNNIVSRAALGKKYNEENGETRFKAIIGEIGYLMGVFNVADLIPSLSWVNHLNGLNSRVEKTFRDIDSFFDEVIEEHIEKRKNRGDASIPEEEEDFVDVMLRISTDMTIGMQLDKDSIKAVTLDMFAAGTDTSSVLMEWAMSELITHPEIMEEVQKEVRCIGRGKLTITESDTENMHYLKLIIKETLRLHPPLPLLVPHASIETVKIQGYDIPANATVFINAYAIGRDPMFWEEPERFYPKRFLNGASMASIDFKGQDFQLIPFGAGRRGCPGISFATIVVELTLANLLNRFDWTFPKRMSLQDFDMKEGHGLTSSRKNELILTAKPYVF